MPASPIRKLAPVADQAKREGKHVFHLNIGQPDIETPAGMLQAVKDISFKVWAYTPSEGLASYRNKLATYYQKVGYKIGAEHIMITNGGSEAITLAMNSCLDNGDELIIPEPFYANYNGFAWMSEVKIVPIRSYIDNGFALPSVAEFEKLIGPRTKGIMICNPNNPTGYLYTRAELEALRDLVIKHDLFLFCDEAYREFCYDGGEFISPMQLEGLDEHVVILDTISKRYSACGARLGALITRNKAVMESAVKYGNARLSPPLVAQIAAEAAVDTPDSYFTAVMDEYTGRRDLLVGLLNKMEGVFCPNPGGAFYVMAKLPIDNADRFCKWMLQEFSLNNQTVMMAPGSGFYSSPDTGLDEVRMAYVLNKEDLSKAMDCLEEALKVYPGRTQLVSSILAGM